MSARDRRLEGNALLNALGIAALALLQQGSLAAPEPAAVAAAELSPAPVRLPAAPPAAMTMSEVRLDHAARIVLKGLEAGGYPGAAVMVGRRGHLVYQKGFGRLSWEVNSPPVDPDSSVYDVASLTKVIGTTAAIMVLLDDGKLLLDDPVGKFLPEFRAGDKGRVTIRQLLLHTSGLPAGRQLWLQARTPMTARELVLQTRLICRPGSCYLYSDLGADVLGFVVEKVSGRPLDTFLRDRVYAPLGLVNTMFKPARELRYRIAPTEIAPPRGYRVHGEVHDESAFALGGVTGHAGLFSTASDLAVFAQMMLNGGSYNGMRIVAESTVRLFTTRASGTRALGWDTANGELGAGQFLSPRAYGHTGYTGTSLWIDPERDLFVILLTNRVHAPKVRQSGYLMADIRNDLMDAVVLAVLDAPPGAERETVVFRSDTATHWNARTVRR